MSHYKCIICDVLKTEDLVWLCLKMVNVKNLFSQLEADILLMWTLVLKFLLLYVRDPAVLQHTQCRQEQFWVITLPALQYQTLLCHAEMIPVTPTLMCTLQYNKSPQIQRLHKQEHSDTSIQTLAYLTNLWQRLQLKVFLWLWCEKLYTPGILSFFINKCI